MNDELELIEEFQSDSIDELASERKKNKVIQRFTMQPSSSTKYYYIENYPNRDSIKSEISPENLDELGKNNRGSLAKEKHRSDSLFYATIPIVLHYEGGYVNDKFDRGGETNMGITQMVENGTAEITCRALRRNCGPQSRTEAFYKWLV